MGGTTHLEVVTKHDFARNQLGLWSLPHKDAGNWARCDLPGTITGPPREVWSYGGSVGRYCFAGVLTLDNAQHYVAQVGAGLRLIDSDAKVVWNKPLLGVECTMFVGDINGQGGAQILVSRGKAGLALYDARTGNELWTWQAPAESVIMRFQSLNEARGLRLFVFPAFSTLGLCYDFRGAVGAPRILWERDYADKYWPGYGPSLVLSDMDNDGVPELVIASKPAYAGVLDVDTGEVKFDLKYEVQDPLNFGRPDGADIGRPYGLLHAADIDGDGFCDLVMVSTQVEQYIAVLANKQGRALESAWTLFIEKDFPEDHRDIHVQPTSLVDVNGDGRLELVMDTYNLDGNERWQTVVIDPFQGHEKPLGVLADRRFHGCHDIDGDGVPEIIVSPTGTGRGNQVNTLEAISGRDLALSMASLEDALPATHYTTLYRMTRPLAANIQYYGALDLSLYLDDEADSGLVVERTDTGVTRQVWRLRDGQTVLTPLGDGAFSEALKLAKGGTVFDGSIGKSIPPALSGGSDVVTESPSASCPLVCINGGRRELVLSLSDGTVVVGEPDLERPGQLMNKRQVPGIMPAVWQDSTGRSLLFVADPHQERIVVYRPDGNSGVFEVEQTIVLNLPLNRNRMMTGLYPRGQGGMIPFGEEDWYLFVPMRLGEHQLACALYDSKGAMLWQDVEVGPHPRQAAIADLDGDGRVEIVVDNHGMQYIYDLSGARRMVAHNWGDTIPGRDDGCAHALPIIGPFGPDGSLRTVMTPGFSAIETQTADGERVAVRPMTHYSEFSNRASAIASLSEGDWGVGVISEAGIFFCVDVQSCKDRWTLDLNCPTSCSVVCRAADLNGDGVDEFLVGLPDGRLVAIGECEGQGVILWTVRFGTALVDVIVADVDGDGLPEIIVETDDGYVRLLKDAQLASPQTEEH